MNEPLRPNEARAIEGNDNKCLACGAAYSIEYNKGDVFYAPPCPCCMVIGKGISKENWDKWHKEKIISLPGDEHSFTEKIVTESHKMGFC